MNNKMAINTYLSAIVSKTQIKQTRRRETESWRRDHFDGYQMGGSRGWAQR